MLDRVVSHEEMVQLIDELGASRRLVGPVKRRDHYFYERVDRASALDLDFTYCEYGPKAVLFPARDTLFTFERENGSFTTRAVYDDTPLALAGVHPCDVNAICLLDRVFADTHRDEHYLRRREQVFIIAIDCPRPCADGVFCRDMKANQATEGFDLMCYPLRRDDQAEGVDHGVVFGTAAGRELVNYARVGRSANLEDEQALKRYGARKEAAFPNAIPCDIDALAELLDRSYDSLLWEATARRCYSCGSCNLSCPTCYCFNTFDETDMSLRSGSRRRSWDGCQLPGFAEVAGGHNFRPKAASRLRHRIYRKAKWVREQHGVPGCVGCARCDRGCTAKIQSVEIYSQLAEER